MRLLDFLKPPEPPTPEEWDNGVGYRPESEPTWRELLLTILVMDLLFLVLGTFVVVTADALLRIIFFR